MINISIFMKLRNYTSVLLCVCALASCGEDDVPKIEEPDLTPDATLSIVANPDGKIRLRAEIEADATPSEIINRLTVLVFSADGTFQSMADSVAAEGISLTEIKNIPVKSGVVKVLVIANRDMSTALNKRLTDVLAMTTTLDKETHKRSVGLLTMSSQVFDCSITRGKHNRMGYGNPVSSSDVSLVADPINLYRSVARLQLSGLTLKETTSVGTAKSFEADSIFVVNVKSISKIASLKADDVLESTILLADEAEQWWTGGWPNAVGVYKTIAKEKMQSYLGYSFKTPPANWDSHPYYDPRRTGIQKALIIGGNNSMTKTDAFGIGNFFYAYENSRKDGAGMTKDGTQTLLVVKGTYTYVPTGAGELKKMENRYYTMIVNDATGTTSFDKEVNRHTGIRRNYQYNLHITIAGPGSDGPYDKDAQAWVTAKVEVLPWGVIKIDAPDIN